MIALVVSSGPVPDRNRRRLARAAAFAVFKEHRFNPAACAAAAAAQARHQPWFDRRRASCWHAAELAAIGAYWPDYVDRDPSARLAWLSLGLKAPVRLAPR